MQIQAITSFNMKAGNHVISSHISRVASISSMCYSLVIMAATAERPITLPQTERKQVQDLEAFLGRGNAVLLSSTGERIDLPNTVFEILRRVVTLMAHGQAVTLVRIIRP